MNDVDFKIILKAQRLYYKSGLSFRDIQIELNISLSDAIHYCTDLKYKIEPELLINNTNEK